MNKTIIKPLTLNEVKDLDLGAKVFLLLSRNNFLECYHCIINAITATQIHIYTSERHWQSLVLELDFDKYYNDFIILEIE